MDNREAWRVSSPNHGFSLTNGWPTLKSSWGKRQSLIWKKNNDHDHDHDEYTHQPHAPSDVAFRSY